MGLCLFVCDMYYVSVVSDIVLCVVVLVVCVLCMYSSGVCRVVVCGFVVWLCLFALFLFCVGVVTANMMSRCLCCMCLSVL